MTVTIFPGTIAGSLQAYPSKSHMQRLIAAALLTGAEISLQNASESADCLALLSVATQLGAQVSWQNSDTVFMKSAPAEQWLKNDGEISIHFGESGLASRMMVPVLSLSRATCILSAHGSLPGRPMQPLYELFAQWKVEYTGNGLHLPTSIKGPATLPRITHTDASGSSQFLSGMLLAASHQKMEVSIETNEISSRPYIDLTLQTMGQMGMRLPTENSAGHFSFSSTVVSSLPPKTIAVEGDWSGAAFLLVAAAIAGSITLTGLDAFSTQPDKAIVQALHEAGAVMSVQPTEVWVSKPQNGLKAFQIDATHSPDLFPPLAALAACAKGKSVIAGVHRLRHKESDRALTIQQQLGILGIKVMLQDDLMIVEGSSTVKGGLTQGCHDHRIVMMLAVLGLVATNAVTIQGAEAVNKSYPAFFTHMALLGNHPQTNA